MVEKINNRLTIEDVDTYLIDTFVKLQEDLGEIDYNYKLELVFQEMVRFSIGEKRSVVMDNYDLLSRVKILLSESSISYLEWFNSRTDRRVELRKGDTKIKEFLRESGVIA